MSKLIYTIPFVIIAIIVITIIVNNITPSFSMVYVEPAQYETVSKNVNAKAYILRKENYVTNESGGVLCYNIDDAGAVSTGGTIARIYENETDAINSTKINKLNTEIENLRKLNSMSNVVGASLESINKSLNSNIQKFISDTKNNDFTNASKSLDSLLYSLNERQIVTGKISDFNEKIEDLQNEKIILEQSTKASIGQIISNTAGIFTSHTDGFEDLYDYQQVTNMTYPQLVNLQEANVQGVPKNVIGKVISDVNWFICCPMKSEDAESFNDISETVEINIPYASTASLNANLVSINTDYNTGNSVVIFECKDMNSTLAKIRNEEVNISVKKYYGIKIKKTAIHNDKVTRTVDNSDGTTKTEEANVEGVYILHGNELRFKEIVKLYETDEYVICDTDTENENLFNGTTIKLYDKIVTEGTDLYAGKIVKQSTEIE